MDKQDNIDLLKTIRERFTLMEEADEDNRREAMKDFKFINVPGNQWDEDMKLDRGDRPCYEFNKIRVTSKRIINDMKANRAQGKVRGVEGQSDKTTADIFEGLIRNIWTKSNGDSITDAAAEYQVCAGMGAWRIKTEYSNDNAFDQDIVVEGIDNPFCLYSDPSARDPLKRDAHDWILTEKISNKEYETRYPKAEKVDFESAGLSQDDDWSNEEETRIAEYWYKEPTTKEIWQLQDGKVIDAESDEAAIIGQQPEAIKKRRTIKCDKIMMVIASGDAILEGPTEWAGKMHPFVQIYGEYFIIDGKICWHGIGRFAKDAQRSYNVSRTAITETIAMAPQAKNWATAKQSEGHTDKWAEAHKKNFPFILYNSDPQAPGPPLRMGGADVPVALIQESQMASEEINMVTGIFAADVGAANQASSGRQEIARQQQGAIATFNYQDNRAKGIQRTWEILIDLVPKIYDTERELRILGSDDAEDYVKVNTFVPDQQGNPVKVNDLSVGRYDVAVTVGPNFTTKRQEAAEIYQQLTQSNPQVFPLIGDLIFKSMDLPYSEDIAERLAAMLPPEIQSLVNKDGKEAPPPEVQAMMQQANQAMQQVQEQGQAVQEAAQKVGMEKSEVEKLKADLETQTAKFEAKIAKEVANIAKLESKLELKAINLEKNDILEEGHAAVGSEQIQMQQVMAEQMEQAITNIQTMAAQFNEYAVGVMNEITAEKEKEPRIIRIDSVRENGKLSAVPVYDDDKPARSYTKFDAS